jgi:hypothetical protein
MDLAMTRGDDVTFDVAATTDATDALAVTFSAKRAYRDADLDALIRKDLEGGVLADEDGIHVTVAADDTRDLAAPIVLVWDVEVVDADGLTQTVDGGYLRVGADVTRDSGFVPGSGS